VKAPLVLSEQLWHTSGHLRQLPRKHVLHEAEASRRGASRRRCTRTSRRTARWR
jgi:hypothetical protein